MQASFDIPASQPASVANSYVAAPDASLSIASKISLARPAVPQPRANHNVFPSPPGKAQRTPVATKKAGAAAPLYSTELQQAMLDAEEAKYTSPRAAQQRSLLPEDVNVIAGEDEDTAASLASHTSYIAPPASLFALVATPVPGATSDGSTSTTFVRDTKNSFVHIHSSNSDHGTASAALASAEAVGSPVSSHPPLHGGSSSQRHGHHHQSLSSTPLPLEPGDEFSVHSPSPTLGSFASNPSTSTTHNAKRRTNLTSGMMSPEEETEAQAMDGDESTQDGELMSRTDTDASRAGTEEDRSSSVGKSEFSTTQDDMIVPPPMPETMQDMQSITASADAQPLQPIVFNITLQLSKAPQPDAAAQSETTDHPASAPTSDLQPLLSSLLHHLPASSQTFLSATLKQRHEVRLGKVELKDIEQVIGEKTREQETATNDAEAESVAAALVAATSEASGSPATKPLPPDRTSSRIVRAKSLFVPRGPSKFSVLPEDGPASAKDDVDEALSPTSPTSPAHRGTSSRSSSLTARYLLGEHADLAAATSRVRRASFLSKPLHALAHDPESEVEEEAFHGPDVLSDAAIQASLDQDVLLGDDTEYGISSHEKRASVTSTDMSQRSGSSHSDQHRLSPKMSPKHQQRSASTLSEFPSKVFFDPSVRESSPDDASSMKSKSNHARAMSVGVGSPPRRTRGSSAHDSGAPSPASGEDTELRAIHLATLLVERLKLEPTPASDSSISAAQREQQRDVHRIYDRILSHLLRLKKMITRRHFKSSFTLQSKLARITDDRSVVDWISNEFLSAGKETGQGGDGTMTTTNSRNPSRRATMAASPFAADDLPKPVYARSATTSAKVASEDLGDEREKSSPTEAAPAADAPVTEKSEPIEIVVAEPEPYKTSAPPYDDTLVAWTSPFSYPLSSAMKRALAARPLATHATIMTTNLQSDLDTLLKSAESDWSFDIFRLNSLSDFHPVLSLSLYTFTHHPTLARFVQEKGIRMEVVCDYMREIEAGYDWSQPYHGPIHSADILQNTMYFLSSDLLKECLTPLDILSLLFSAIIHDFRHVGRTNNFLIQTGDELSVKFNDQSCLENHSLVEAFLLMKKFNFLEPLTRQEQQAFRNSVVSAVLHTDMKQHVTTVQLFESTVMKHRNAGTWFSKDSPTDRKLLADFVLHVADIANPSKPLTLALQWTELIMCEYWSQGDAERALGLPISPMMDRNFPTIDTFQFAFINVIVLPLVSQLSEVLNDGSLAPCIQHLVSNRAYYQNRMNLAKAVARQSVLIKITATGKGGALGPQALLKPVGARVLKAPPPSVLEKAQGQNLQSHSTDPEADAENATYTVQTDESEPSTVKETTLAPALDNRDRSSTASPMPYLNVAIAVDTVASRPPSVTKAQPLEVIPPRVPTRHADALSSSAGVKCETCPNDAELRCEQCENSVFCEDCSQDIHAKGRMKAHHPVDLAASSTAGALHVAAQAVFQEKSADPGAKTVLQQDNPEVSVTATTFHAGDQAVPSRSEDEPVLSTGEEFDDTAQDDPRDEDEDMEPPEEDETVTVDPDEAGEEMDDENAKPETAADGDEDDELPEESHAEGDASADSMDDRLGDGDADQAGDDVDSMEDATPGDLADDGTNDDVGDE